MSGHVAAAGHTCRDPVNAAAVVVDGDRGVDKLRVRNRHVSGPNIETLGDARISSFEENL